GEDQDQLANSEWRIANRNPLFDLSIRYSLFAIRYSLFRHSLDSLSAAKAEVQPSLDFLHIEAGVRADGPECRRGEIHRLRAEAQIIVFDLGRPVLVDGVFKAGAGRPAGVQQAVARRRAGEIGQRALIFGQRQTAFAVDQEPVERRTDPAGDGRGPLHIGIEPVTDRVSAFVLDIGPAEIALEPEHEPVELRIGADLSAAEEAPVVEIVVATAERI